VSVLQEALATSGVELERDVPKGKRGANVWARVIAAVRAAEASMFDELREVEKRCSEAERERNQVLQEKQTLQDENFRLKGELAKRRLAEKMVEMSSLTVADRTKLLELSAVGS
jgi:hypothetical protein